MHTFRMPLFVFASGLVLSYGYNLKKNPPGFTRFCVNKFQRLLTPYLILGILVFPLRAVMSPMADDAIELSFSSFVKSLTFADSLSIVFLWFLPMSFICQLIGYAGYSIRRINITAFFIAITCLALILHFDRPLGGTSFLALNEVGRLLVFFMAGMICGHFINRFSSIIKWHSLITFVIWLAIWVTCYFISDSLFMRFLCALAGIGMIISLANLLAHHKITVLDHLDGATYMIFLLSWFCHVLSQQVLHHFSDFPWWIYTVISISTAIHVPLFIYRFLYRHSDRNRLCAILLFILGHSSKPKHSTCQS